MKTRTRRRTGIPETIFVRRVSFPIQNRFLSVLTGDMLLSNNSFRFTARTRRHTVAFQLSCGFGRCARDTLERRVLFRRLRMIIDHIV